MFAPLFTLSFPNATTRVYLGSSLLRDAGFWEELLSPRKRVFVVADSGVASPWLPLLLEALNGFEVLPAVLPAGEATKSRAHKEALEDLWVSAHGSRESIALALGGGVIGDLTGFTAATYLRGIPHIQIPTTLLAMVDSSLGGKTAVDHPSGKNLIGAFHPALALVADIATLSTLPEAPFRQGMVEAIKHGVIRDRAFFEWIEAHLEAILSREEGFLLELVEKNLRIKGKVVEEDPFEGDLRQILNFGHTLGHAFEQVSNYALPHGEAVALGIVGELVLARRLQGFPEEESTRIVKLLERLGFPAHAPQALQSLGKERILLALTRDKKVKGKEIRFSLPKALGSYPPHPRYGYSLPVAEEAIIAALASLGIS